MTGDMSLNSGLDHTTGKMSIRVSDREIPFFYPESTSMRNILGAIFEGREYPLLLLPQYAPVVIMDIGANIGAAAVYFATQFPDAQIYCYEPSSRNFKYLEKNTEFFDRIRAFPYGLFNETCEARLYYGRDQPAQDSVIRNMETTDEGETVRLVKASEEMEMRSITEISILKIDTEGCEIPILGEFSGLLERTDMIYCEYHSEDDRLEADRLLSKGFLLFYAYGDTIHRGHNAYVSRSLAARYPALERARITRR
jgi:FkbM family methyltransferase